jgi:MGT family glycosyltransferase
VKQWLADLIGGLERDAGLPREGEISPHLVIAFTTEAMVGPLDRFPQHYRFVGPSISDRPEPTPFPWETLADKPRVLISMGTVNAEASGRFYATAVEALRDEPVQMIIAGPDPAAPGAIWACASERAGGMIIQRYVPQLALLPKVDAVVCHGGHNTTSEALANGLPLVIAPIKDDQPIVADQVVAAGAGLRVKFGRVQPAELRAAVRRVLDEPAFRDAARKVAASFAAAGGAAAAATALEGLG